MALLNHSSGQANKRTKITFQPRKSWTHDFCLLSDNSRGVTPSVKQLSKLTNAGLGRRRILFPEKAIFQKFKCVLETEYSKFKNEDGAFELMRAEWRQWETTLPDSNAIRRI